jgi:outer membrane receptor protein involved in Fe transport
VTLDGNALTTVTPRDANYNPNDAKIDNNTFHGVLGYQHATPLGRWDTTASVSYSEIADIRGFLRPDLDNSGADNSDSQNQRRRIADDYFDTHLTTALGHGIELVWGADLLYGAGYQRSVNGAYYAPLDGRGPVPATTSLHVDEINRVRDWRVFAGQYAQAQWRPDNRWTITLGARLNETGERKISTHWDGFDPTADSYDSRKRIDTRGSGTAGVNYKVWSLGADEMVLFADWRSAFKPAAIDFGPDNTPDILHSERAQTWEAGVKGALAAGRFSYELGGFLQNFHNLVIVEDDGSFANAGAQRMKGVEGEGRWKVGGDLTLMASASWHDARFTRYQTATTDFSGTELTLSPHWLASAGVVWRPASGPFATLTANYVGERYLAMGNQAPTGAYTTADASLGWRFGRWRAGVYGYNLGDVRAPVTASEFGEQSYYLLNPRSLFAMVGASF